MKLVVRVAGNDLNIQRRQDSAGGGDNSGVRGCGFGSLRFGSGLRYGAGN